MCGIFALFNKNNTSLSSDTLQSISNSIRHRGPDDEGFLLIDNGHYRALGGKDTPKNVYDSSVIYCPKEGIEVNNVIDSEVVLLHRRLSIVDLSELGHQPLCDKSGRYWMIYNGEIYNYVEIKEELQQLGYEFATESDSEVLLFAYIHWGEECQNRFNGMWSAIIFDTDNRTYWVSRDRLGVKPLYVFEDDNFLIFVSEIKSLLPLRDNGYIELKPNEEIVKKNLVTTASTSGKYTEFLNVSRFPAASWGLFKYQTFDASLINSYWQIPYANQDSYSVEFDKERAATLANEYYELLKDAVRVRLRGDVAIGSALSGGLDSSSLVYLVNEIQAEEGLTNQQHTFSNVYSGDLSFMDESESIKVLAESLNVESHRSSPDAKAFKSQYVDRVFHRERSSLEASLQGAVTYSMPRVNGVTITLDGQGADEQLGGYSGYWRNYAYTHPRQGFRELNKTRHLSRVSLLSVVVARFLVPNRLIDRFIRFVKTKNAIKCIAKANIELGKEACLSQMHVVPTSLSLSDSLRSSIDNGLKTLLWEDDIDGMSYSVESRQPYIDYRVVEFLAKLPDCYKMHDGYTKYIARLAFDDKLPNQIVWSKDKQGFPGPVEYWIKNNVEGIGDWADSKILSHTQFYNIKSLNELQVIKGSDIDFYVRLLVTSIWYSEYFVNRSAKFV